MNFFIDPLLKINEYNDLLGYIRNYAGAVSVVGPSDSQKTHMVYSLCTHLGVRSIYITFNDMQARKAYEDFCFFYGEENILYFPAKEIMLYNVEARSNDYVYQRVNT
jgi:transcription-repair coupling factor (superfamily II helicase)